MSQHSEGSVLVVQISALMLKTLYYLCIQLGIWNSLPYVEGNGLFQTKLQSKVWKNESLAAFMCVFLCTFSNCLQQECPVVNGCWSALKECWKCQCLWKWPLCQSQLAVCILMQAAVCYYRLPSSSGLCFPLQTRTESLFGVKMQI